MPAIVPKPYAQMQREFADECQRLAELAFRRACQNNYDHLYLCGSKETGLDTLNPRAAIWRRLSVATAEEIDARPELTIVRQEKLPAHHRTIEHLAVIIRDWLKSEPLWIFAD